MEDKVGRGDDRAAKAIEMLRVSIAARIEDFNAFFKHNFADYRAPLFEKQKFRLRKLVGQAREAKQVKGELDIHFAIDDTINIVKHNAMRQERPKTPNRVTPIKSVKKAMPVKVEPTRTPAKKQNAIVQIKMTREEYENYTHQPQNMEPAKTAHVNAHAIRSKSPIHKKRFM